MPENAIFARERILSNFECEDSSSVCTRRVKELESSCGEEGVEDGKRVRGGDEYRLGILES